MLPFHLSAPAPLHCLACICAVVARNRGWIWPQVKRYHKILQASTLLKGTTTFQKIQKKKQQKMREKMSQKHANVIKIPFQTVEIYIYICIWIHDASFARDAIWDRKGAAVSFRWKRSLECTNRHQEVKSCSKNVGRMKLIERESKKQSEYDNVHNVQVFSGIYGNPPKRHSNRTSLLYWLTQEATACSSCLASTSASRLRKTLGGLDPGTGTRFSTKWWNATHLHK